MTGKKILQTDVIYEVQQRKFLGSFLISPTEWYNEELKPKTKEQVELPKDWTWVSEWQNDGVDSYEHSSKLASKHWNAVPGAFDFVRRRKWTRTRMKIATDEEIKSLGDKIKVTSGEEQVYKHVTKLQDELKTEFEKVIKKTNKPNILLLGGSGAGKSSLVNAVFGKTLAEIGEGKPITQNYTKYSGEDSPVVIYDSRGIEHGYAQKGFSEDTRLFFEKLNSNVDKENHIHVVWYVLDLTQARFQPFEADFCRNELKDYPIIFVLNKADAVDKDVRNTMLKVIDDFKMPNCHALFSTVANCKNFDTKTCDQCGSGKIKKRIQGEQCTVMCKECKAKYVLEKTAGIKELSKTTIEVMPELVKSVFINSHKNELLSKDKEVKQLIVKYAQKAQLKDSAALIEMSNEVIKLYGMEMISDLIIKKVQERYKKYYDDAGSSKRAGFWLNQVFAGSSLATALFLAFGFEISRNCIEFKSKIITTTIKEYNDTEIFKTLKKEEKEEEITTEEIKKEEKEEKIDSDSLNGKVKGIICSFEHESESEYFIEKSLENLQIDVDTEIVRNVINSLRNFMYQPNLFFVQVDLTKGTKQFSKVWEAPPKPKRQK